MKRFSRILLFSVLAVFLVGGTAMATPILDFGIVAPTAGTISYGGGNAPLVGTSIEVDQVVGLFTPCNNNITLTICGGLLNFTTGALTGTGPDPGQWQWGGGSSTTITLTGGVDIDGDMTNGCEIPLGTTLMHGSFGTAWVNTTSGTSRITGSGFHDFKDNTLLDFYCLPTGTEQDPMKYEGSFNIGFIASVDPDDGSFESITVLSGDVWNSPVPEPATMLLLGSGLIGLAAVGRKKFKKL